MKKIVSLFLAAFMVFNMVCFSTAANTGTSLGEDAKAVFLELGVLTAEETGEANLNSVITRAEFAQYAAKVMNMQYGSEDVLFSDIPADSFYLSSVNALVSAGILSVSSDLKFYPNNPIKYEEAVKMVVCAAGYGETAKIKGGWPQGYIAAASEAGILEAFTVADKTALTVGEALQLLYNASTVGVYEKISDGASYTYEVSDETLLSKYHNIYLQEGVIMSMNGASIDENYTTADGEAMIDGLAYLGTEDINENEYLGSRVEFVYKYDKQNDNGEIISISKKNPEKEEKILAEDYIDFDSERKGINYYTGKNKKRTEYLKPGITVVYNGYPYGGKTADALNKLKSDYTSGEIYLKDTNKDGEYDYLIINCYKTFVVTNYSEKTVYNKLNIGENICTDDYDIVKVRTAEGQSTVLSTAYPYVAQLAESANGERLDIILPSMSKTGILSAIGDDEITVGSEVLDVNEKYFNDNKKLWKINSEVTVLTDSSDKVVYLTENSSSSTFNLGYLIKSVYNEDDEYIMFKLYDYNSGKIKLYQADEKVKIDGVKYKAQEETDKMFRAFPNTEEAEGKLKIAPQLIRFKATDENIIIEIDTETVAEGENPDNTLYRVFTYAGRKNWYGWNGGLNRFDTTILYDASVTKVLTIPDFSVTDVDSVTDKDFGNTVPSELKGEKEKTMYPFKYDNSTLYTDVIVYEGDLSKAGDHAMMYISVGKGLNSDDEVVNMIKVNDKGVETNIVLAEGISVPEAVEEGDLIAVTVDGSGYVSEIVRMYSRTEMKFKEGTQPYGKYADYIYALPGYASSYAYRAVGKQLSRGYVYQKAGNNIMFTYEIGNAALDGPGYQMIGISGVPVVVYDSTAREGKRVYNGSADDIVDYKSAGEQCTYLLLATHGTTMDGIYIYK